MTKEEARIVWLAGFHSSGEGFNGEYPFNHPGRPDADEVEILKRSFEEWWDEYRADGVKPAPEEQAGPDNSGGVR